MTHQKVSAPDTVHPRCPIRTTLEMVGGKWRLLIIQQLRDTPRRFGELAHAIPEISEKMLTQELRHLQQQQLVQRDAESHYRLTEAGLLVLPLIAAMADFGRAYEAQVKLRAHED
jgi:DNA-binding HxlR family transcriptional regulator